MVRDLLALLYLLLKVPWPLARPPALSFRVCA